MQQRLTGMMAVVMLFAWMQSAFSMTQGIIVTATTQYDQGLDFTLTTTPERDATVIVRMEIPQKGKLKNLAALQMELNDDKGTLLVAPLAPTTHNGVVSVSFQIARKLVAQCAINLFPERNQDDPRYSIFYAVRLKSYVPAAAVDPG